MKHFHLKLGIGIIVVFGLLLAGFALYEPVWFKYYEWRLCSDNPDARAAAAETVIKRGYRAIPYIKKWLMFENERLFCGACGILENMEGDGWRQFLPRLEEVLSGPHSVKTDAVTSLLHIKDVFNFRPSFGFRWGKYQGWIPLRRNVCIFMLFNYDNPDRYSNSEGSKITAITELLDMHDSLCVMPLVTVLGNDFNANVRKYGDCSIFTGF